MSGPTLAEAIEWGNGHVGALSLNGGKYAAVVQAHLAILLRLAQSVANPGEDVVERVAKALCYSGECALPACLTADACQHKRFWGRHQIAARAVLASLAGDQP